jgi:TonB family protein
MPKTFAWFSPAPRVEAQNPEPSPTIYVCEGMQAATMRRLGVLLALLVLGWGFVRAQAPNERPPEKNYRKFEPAEVVSADKAIRPYNSVAFGTVLLQITIDAAGEAQEITVVRAIPSLTESALKSAKKWKFNPAKLDGKPVRSTIQLAFVFVPPVTGASSRAVTRDSAAAPIAFEPARVVSPDETMYPPLSIAAGTVVLQVMVGPAGEAVETKVVRGIPSLTEQAMRSVKKWTFAAAQLGGRRVRSTVYIAYVFTPPVSDP